ncbi:MAG: aromatic amino acid hydroxylase [Bdellovibrionaceae bacterium]|nr:aromatic amino acid hydroxylase [Pseudobdellovibrionaceae bacterium]
MAEALPKHLRRYVVAQNYEKYTPMDQAVWRFILRQLRAFLSVHAHHSYLEGLEKTGIEVERIPRIADISEKISKFGWRAIPVSGFIPPAAFMELQALSILPIASDLRTLEHLLYTPAPDIVHEAAGHAPILVNPEFAQYLKEYAQVARKAIISREDLELYEAIRDLSDCKENPNSTPAQIQAAQDKLDRVSNSISHVSEAGELSRMNWWTAEYGLIGSLDNPKLFGAGLLSSVGESKVCLSDKVRKIPLTVDCIRQGYDITEQQPQLFVTPDFKTLSKVLEDMAQNMAFRTGGLQGLKKALLAKSLTTSQWSSGVQVSGVLANVIEAPQGTPAYLQFSGPCQLSYLDAQLEGHGPTYHAQGFGSPVGLLKNHDRCLSDWDEHELHDYGFRPGHDIVLEFASGVKVEGHFQNLIRHDSKNMVLSFEKCTVTHGSKRLFEPAWGTYDMAVGAEISSVFGGAADRGAFGETDDFVAVQVPPRQLTPAQRAQNEQFERLRALRESGARGPKLIETLTTLLRTHDQAFVDDWLFRVEALELVLSRDGGGELESKLRADLEALQSRLPTQKATIADGLSLAAQL